METAPCRDRKPRLRQEAIDKRKALQDKDLRSLEIWRNLEHCREYQAAETIMLYLDIGSEVRTRFVLPRLLGVDTSEIPLKKGGRKLAFLRNKKVIIPYCVESRILLFRLVLEDDIAPGAFGIHEPLPSLRQVLDRKALPEEIDLALLPGVAFDRTGGRLGRGKGYYDRFVPNLRSGCVTVGLAFECQLLSQVPMEAHDRYLDLVVTEKDVYRR